jgi:hypothetical protein
MTEAMARIAIIISVKGMDHGQDDLGGGISQKEMDTRSRP